jgi:hypothetical protein
VALARDRTPDPAGGARSPRPGGRGPARAALMRDVRQAPSAAPLDRASSLAPDLLRMGTIDCSPGCAPMRLERQDLNPIQSSMIPTTNPAIASCPATQETDMAVVRKNCQRTTHAQNPRCCRVAKGDRQPDVLVPPYSAWERPSCPRQRDNAVRSHRSTKTGSVTATTMGQRGKGIPRGHGGLQCSMGLSVI